MESDNKRNCVRLHRKSAIRMLDGDQGLHDSADHRRLKVNVSQLGEDFSRRERHISKGCPQSSCASITAFDKRIKHHKQAMHWEHTLFSES